MKPWNEMSARERDALIAEKIIGWTEVEFQKLTHVSGEEATGIRPNEQASPYTGYKPRYKIPYFTTDIAAAWEVFEKIKGCFSGGLRLEYDKGLGGYYIYAVPELGESYVDEPVKSRLLADSDTAPEVICLAALKAMGIEQ